jgi:hypothetical protein
MDAGEYRIDHVERLAARDSSAGCSLACANGPVGLGP